jgi:hypothetical protein
VKTNHHEQCSKLTGEKQGPQSGAAMFDLREDGRANELNRRLKESALRTCERFELSRLPRWTEAVLVELIRTQIGWWIEKAAETFERVCPAEIAGVRRERLKALNIWISIAYCWYALCPAYNAPVWLFLFEFLSASGEPLPITFEAANRTRARLMAEVRAVVQGVSRLGQSHRLRVLLSNPCVLGVMLEFGPLPSRQISPVGIEA